MSFVLTALLLEHSTVARPSAFLALSMVCRRHAMTFPILLRWKAAPCRHGVFNIQEDQVCCLKAVRWKC